MSEGSPQSAPATRGRGGGSAGRGQGGGNAIARGTATLFLNPERAPPLISKWQKALGKDLESIEVKYTADGVSVELTGMPGTAFRKYDDEDNLLVLSVPEYREIKAKESLPKGDDAIFAFKNKFEVRLNQEFPEGVDLGDGSEAAIRKAVQALPFAHRRVMLMSNKQFKTAYPNGYTPVAAAAT